MVGERAGPQSVIQSLETGPGQDLHTGDAGTRHLTLGNSEGGQLGSLRMEGEKCEKVGREGVVGGLGIFFLGGRV